jgi:hypothetical protein
MVFGKLWATEWVCPACGCNATDATVRNCDECLLKFYFDNENASNFADWHEPNKLDLPKFEWEWFSKGYDGGVDDVLTALSEFCGQGGILDAKNVVAWANTYATQSNATKEQN